jgi:hypothetical protein
MDDNNDLNKEEDKLIHDSKVQNENQQKPFL